MGNAVKILWDWFRAFVPALKTETIIVGWSLILCSLCLAEVCYTSGLRGPLTYLILSPGITVPAFFAGVGLLVCAYTWKPIPREDW